MKKINYLVLMAAMMLIGTNAWADTRTAGNAGELESAWKAAGNGDVIKLTNDISVEKILWLGTTKMNDAAKSITLDLNGYTLQNVAALKYMFFITHGELNIITSEAGGKIIQNNASNEELFRLTGSTYKDVNPKTATSGYFTHLTIGEGVNVKAQKKNAIVIDQLSAWPLTSSTIAVAAGSLTYPTSLPYNTCVYSGSANGVGNGVRVDVYGIIYGEKYAFKANGNLRSPSYAPKADLTGYWANPAQTDAYTVVNPGDTAWTPFIRIYSTADLRVPASNDASKKPVAVYCSGYARWLIEGTCVGSTAVYVKSGDVDIHDATIQSNYTGDYVAASATNSGVTASGSAIVIESNAAYSGDIAVEVSGDSHVSATNGYAIDESVTSADNTKVDAITINGGTFEGGQVPDGKGGTTQGTIVISETTARDESPTVITVSGGQVNGSSEENVKIGDQTLAEFLSDSETTTHITTIDNGSGGQTVVITEGAAPTGKTNVAGNEGLSVKWKHSEPEDDSDMTETLTVDLNVSELDITQTKYYQTLTVAEGVTLTAERVILGAKAKIIVEAGAQFIVTGDQGITANSENNILLKTSSSAQAIFLVNPSVNSNRHPKATVDLYSDGYKIDETHYAWQRFGVPAYKESITFSAIGKSYTEPYKTQYQKIVDGNFVVVPVANWETEKLVPFTAYSVSTTYPSAGSVYTFVSELVGNDNATLSLTGKWNFFANSYTAPISISHLISDFKDKFTNMSGTIYLYKPAAGVWYEINNATPAIHPEYPSEISPMYAFAVHRRSEGSNPVINYADEVYAPALAALSSAPARNNSVASFASAVIEIVSADGTKDEVSLLEGEQFSAEFDNTYDAEKMMNKEQTYIYGNGLNEKLSILATDNLEGTTLSMDTKEQTSFIMTVRRASGMNYAIRDMLTGTEVELTEGATYMFTVPANTNVDGRFQIVGVHKVPTAIDNVEEVAATKGIYNMAGQYMGNDYHSLSAGVYVVDGKKVVK